MAPSKTKGLARFRHGHTLHDTIWSRLIARMASGALRERLRFGAVSSRVHAGAAFDSQAASFDRRAGLPLAACTSIAEAVAEIGRLAPGLRLLDLGAGTGDIGLDLLASGISYTGLDVSSAMLDVFRERARASGHSPDLIFADATAEWPVPDGSMRVVFGSRSLHWIETSHLATQCARVAAREGAALLIGRVVRDPEDPRERIRTAMRHRLREAGYEGRSGRGRAREGVAEFVRRGWRPLPSRVVATWPVQRAPRSSVDDWRNKSGLAGRDVPDDVKERVLAEVLRFTTETFGDIDEPVEVTERYVIDGAEIGNPTLDGSMAS